MPDYDYSGEMPKAGDNILKTVASVAMDQKKAELEVARLEEKLNEAKELLRSISEDRLPGIMADAQQSELTTADGIKVSVKNKVYGSIPKGNPEPGLALLEELGSGNLIKRAFTILFGKGDEAWAKKFAADLAKRKKPLNHKVERTVHPQTLQAYVREKLEEGGLTADQMKTLGVFEKKVAVIDYPDEKIGKTPF